MILQSSIAAAERIFRLLDEPEEPADAENCMVLTQAEGDVELSHVKFGYNSVKTIIHDLSFHVKPGKMVAVVGPTGAGRLPSSIFSCGFTIFRMDVFV